VIGDAAAVATISKLVLLFALVPAALSAAERAPNPAELFGDFSFTSRREPIEITSERLDFDYRNRRTLFRGGVQVKQGDIVMKSDTLVVKYQEVDDQQKLSEVAAEGHVTITQGARRATGDRAVFEQSTRTLVLTGNARLEEGSNQLNGDTIIVYPDESRMEVKGQNSRVKLVIFPRAEPEGSASPTPKASGGTATDGSAEGPAG